MGRKTENPALVSLPISTKVKQDGCSHTINHGHAKHLVEGKEPRFDIFDCHHDILSLVVSASPTVCSCLVVSSTHDFFLLVIEEPGTLVVFGDEVETSTGEHDGEETFYDV